MQCTAAERARQSDGSALFNPSIQLLLREIKERGGEKREHENAKKIAGGERAHDFRAERKKVRTPGKTEKRRKPMRRVGGDFRILQKIDDDAEKAEDAAGGDQSAGIERPGAGFAFVFFLRGGLDERTNKAASEHGGGGGNGNIHARGKRQRTHAKNFDGNDQRDAHQYQTPGQALIENAIDNGGHE